MKLPVASFHNMLYHSNYVEVLQFYVITLLINSFAIFFLRFILSGDLEFLMKVILSDVHRWSAVCTLHSLN